MKNRSLVLAGAFLFLAGASNCYGSILVNAIETGGDVIFSGGGTADLAGLTFDTTFSVGSGIIPDTPRFFMAAGIGDAYTGTSGPGSFGPGSTTVSSSSLGDVFGVFSASQILLPIGYVSGADLSSTMTFSSATFASLGMTPGTYTWTWGSGANADSISLQIGAAAPEPTSLALLALALIGAGYARKPRIH